MKDQSFSGLAKAASWGVVLGAGIGFALGMLLAPEEGQKLRRRLGFQMERLSSELGKLIEGLSSTTESSEARDKAKSLVADVEERAQEIRHEMDALLEKYPTRHQATSSN